MPHTQPSTVANYNFTLSLAAQIGRTSPGVDLCFSPASITLILAMFYAGSGGGTKDQLSRLVFSRMSDGEISRNVEHMLKAVGKSNEHFTLAYANRLYVSQEYQLQQTFVKKLKDKYLTDIKPVDFTANAAAIVSEVNRFVETETRQRIRNILQPNDIKIHTALLAISAPYLQGAWANQFAPELTVQHPFYTAESQTTYVNMMWQRAKFRYYENSDVQVLEMPYASSTATMLVLLPRARFGVNSLLGQMTHVHLLNYTEQLQKHEVIVKLPRFSIEQDFNLVPALKSFGDGGIVDLFDPNKANLTGMVAEPSARRLYVTSTLQKSFIDVHENGTEATAATVVTMDAMSRRKTFEEPINFTADHPFLFTILYGSRPDRHVLFFGKFHNHPGELQKSLA